MLTNIAIQKAQPKEKLYRLFDGQGLYLEITPAGGKYWRLKYRFMNKEKRMALGVYPEVSLAEAREKRAEARKLLADYKDPGDAKKQKKLVAKVVYANTFQMIAEEWHESKKAGWKPNHAVSVLRRLNNDIFPALGSRPISEITAPELLAVIRKIESRGVGDLPKRLLQISGQIFRYAVATGRATTDPTGALRGALKVVKTKHHAFISENELPGYLAALEAYDGERMTYLALKLVLLTFVRTGELRGARWEEINFDKSEWRIPPERMKMKQTHIVPLSTQAVEILRELQNYSGNREHVFPNSVRPKGCMSENTLLYALYRMGYHSRATIHGFRSTASTILNEQGFRSDLIERQLAHKETNANRAAYNYAQYLPERREMMQWWADYLDGVRLK